MGTSASSANLPILLTIVSKVSTDSPSSTIKPAERPIGFAPITATSFIVPEMASEPISPPGKIIGCTVCESVEKTISSTTAASSSIERETSVCVDCLVKYLIIFSLIKLSISSPPAPCASLIFSFII